jgi:hypothetical protein
LTTASLFMRRWVRGVPSRGLFIAATAIVVSATTLALAACVVVLVQSPSTPGLLLRTPMLIVWMALGYCVIFFSVAAFNRQRFMNEARAVAFNLEQYSSGTTIPPPHLVRLAVDIRTALILRGYLSEAERMQHALLGRER